MTERIAVCVPIRDEAMRLPRFLAGLAAQSGPAFTACLLLDGCTDASAAIVAAQAPTLPFPIVTRSVARGDANAGRARRAAMALGQEVAGDGILVSTDGDSIPAADWLAATVAALSQADVVAGRIVRDRAAATPVQDRVECYYDALFALRRRLDPVAWEAPRTHHYTSGASLALHAGAYAALDGFEPIASGEDARLVDAAHRAGMRVRHDAAIVVRTSSRRHGRARGGLADHLFQLDVDHALPTMAHPEDCAWRYRAHAAARAAFGADLTPLAHRLVRSAADVAAIAAGSPNAEAFAMRVVPCVPGAERNVALDIAEAALKALEALPDRVAA